MQLRKVLMAGHGDGTKETPETTGVRENGGEREMEKDQREEDDDWVWGGLKRFGGEDGGMEEQGTAERGAGV